MEHLKILDLIHEVAAQAATEAVEQAVDKFEAVLRNANTTENNTNGNLIPLAEVARMFNVTAQTLYVWDKQGYLTKHHVGRKVFYLRDEVESLYQAKKGLRESAAKHGTGYRLTSRDTGLNEKKGGGK